MTWTRAAKWKCILAISAALIAAVAVFQVRFRFAIVLGDSMLPTLRTGDLLLVDKGAFQRVAPDRGDIVMARHGDELIVKRVVGLPGEELSLKAGQMYVNGAAIAENHPLLPGSLEIGRGRLLMFKYALLGDNREMGIYEAVHAVVRTEEIVGKVLWIVSFHRLLAVASSGFAGISDAH